MTAVHDAILASIAAHHRWHDDRPSQPTGRANSIRREKVREPEDSSGFEDSHTVTVADDIADL